MATRELLEMLLETMTLKRMPRTGWLMRGVPHVESVADHSYGVAIVSLVLCDALVEGGDPALELDRERVLIMALLHDLAEVRLTDLPASATHLIPPAEKGSAEGLAITQLLSPLAAGDQFAALWREFEDRASPEGQLVRDADKLEMMVQCLRYEQAGSRGLDEFWDAVDQYEWHFPLCQELYALLKAIRQDGTR
ncbi:HD family hydrolase [Chloroflexota bacterium]